MQHVYKQVCALPYLLKRLRINGWSQRELITAYQARAVILMSCTSAEKTEMTHFQNRILKTIGITSDTAKTLYNITPITNYISDSCHRTFNRIISNESHPITASLTRNKRTQEYTVPRARTASYLNSFMVTHLRELRNPGRRPDLYTNDNANLSTNHHH